MINVHYTYNISACDDITLGFIRATTSMTSPQSFNQFSNIAVQVTVTYTCNPATLTAVYWEVFRILENAGDARSRVTLPDSVAVDDDLLTLPVLPADYPQILPVGLYELRCTVGTAAEHKLAGWQLL